MVMPCRRGQQAVVVVGVHGVRAGRWIARRYMGKMRTCGLPRALYGWTVTDGRDHPDGVSVGAALVEADHAMVWPKYGLCQQWALGAVLCQFLGGVRHLPNRLAVPPELDMRLPAALVAESVRNSILFCHERTAAANMASHATLFDRTYDIICPLPALDARRASLVNLDMARVVARAWADAVPSAPPPAVVELIRRSFVLTPRSLETYRTQQRQSDPARLIHFNSIKIDPEQKERVRGARILVWHHDLSWGALAEAARNILFMGGADRVDVLTAMAPGTPMTTCCFEAAAGANLDDVLFDMERPAKTDDVALARTVIVDKHAVTWDQSNVHSEANAKRAWHDVLGEWIVAKWPRFVPSYVPRSNIYYKGNL